MLGAGQTLFAALQMHAGAFPHHGQDRCPEKQHDQGCEKRDRQQDLDAILLPDRRRLPPHKTVFGKAGGRNTEASERAPVKRVLTACNRAKLVGWYAISDNIDDLPGNLFTDDKAAVRVSADGSCAEVVVPGHENRNIGAGDHVVQPVEPADGVPVLVPGD